MPLVQRQGSLPDEVLVEVRYPLPFASLVQFIHASILPDEVIEVTDNSQPHDASIRATGLTG